MSLALAALGAADACGLALAAAVGAFLIYALLRGENL
jgi:hypothetical protein